MNPDTFDFNIDNYSIDDLENFLGLDDEYSDEDVHKKSNEFSNKINKMSDANFKKKLTEFVTKVKNMLTEQDLKNRITSAGSTFVIKKAKEPVTNYIQQVYSTDVAKGHITTIKKKTTMTSFCMNTLFRDPSSTSSTDCVIELPYQLKNVLSMEVTSVEIPQGLFLFSDYLQSNTIYFKEYFEDTVNQGLVVFPQGNYPTITSNLSSKDFNLSLMMTTEINAQLNTGDRFTVTVNQATNQVTITNSTYIFEMNIVHPGTNRNISRTMGWILGFRQPAYVNQLTYTSESLYNTTPAEYLYLEINDYNVTSISSKVFGLFSESFLDRNIIAKVDYSYKTDFPLYETVSYNKSHVLSSLRDYFGPVYLARFAIRLLDKYGQVVDLNGLDYSFTLELKILYDL
jgi:hypothetical protein